MDAKYAPLFYPVQLDPRYNRADGLWMRYARLATKPNVTPNTLPATTMQNIATAPNLPGNQDSAPGLPPYDLGLISQPINLK